MCASSGTKLLSMNAAVSSSLYDSASSRAHAPHAGAALKSISRGFFCVLASASAASASVNQCTFIAGSPIQLFSSPQHTPPVRNDSPIRVKNLCFLCLLWLKGDGLFGPELEFAVFVDFGFGLQATRDFDDMCKNELAYFVDRFGAIDHAAGRQIEIVRHAIEYRSV